MHKHVATSKQNIYTYTNILIILKISKQEYR